MSLAEQSQQWYPTSVQVTVLQARSLRVKGKNGTNDAYAIMQVAKEKFSTSVAEKSVAPVWKEEAAFDLPLLHPSNAERCTLQVSVMHRALVGPDKLLGLAVVNLLELHDNKSRNKSEWFKLMGKTGKPDKDRGEVLLDIQFMKNNMTASMYDLSGQDKSRSRLGKFKDKLKGKKKDGLSDSASAIVPSVGQILTDSEGEEEADATPGTKKKSKLKSLFAPKGLHRNMSQSMSTLATLPEKDSAISLSRSSGLNVESPEAKKKFRLFKHKRTGSSDSKVSQGSFGQGMTQSNLCINGSHVYTEEPETRDSRTGSTFSLNSSGHGSMEDLRNRKISTTSVDSLKASDLQTQESAMEEIRRRQEEQRKQEEEVRKRQEDERRRQIEEEEREHLRREEMRREEERKRIEKEEERKRIEREEEKRRLEEQEEERRRIEREEEKRRLEKLQEEKRRIEREEEKRRLQEQEEERRRIEREEEKRRLEEQEEERRRIEREEEKRRLEKLEEERRRIEREEEKRRLEEQEEERRRIEREEEKRRLEKLEEERRRIEREEEKRRLEEQEEERRIEREEEKRRLQEQEEESRRVEREEEKRRLQEQEEESRRVEREEEKRRLQEQEEERRRIEKEDEKRRIEREMEEHRRIAEEEMERKEELARIKREHEKARQEEERKRVEEEEERIKEERRKRIEEEERTRLEKERIKKEEEMRRTELERQRAEEEERLQKEKREAEEKRKRIEEEEKRMTEERERKEKELERKEKEEKERVRKKEEEERKKKAEEERIRQEKEELEKQKREREQINVIERPEVKPRSARMNTSKRAEKPDTIGSEYVPSTSPFEDDFLLDETSTSFLQQSSVQPEAPRSSTKMSAVKPSSSVSGNFFSQTSVSNTNPFLDDYDASFGNVVSLGDGTERSEKKRRAPGPPQNKTTQVGKPDVPPRDLQVPPSTPVPDSEDSGDPDVSSSRRDKRPAPLPPDVSKNRYEVLNKERADQSTTSLQEETNPFISPGTRTAKHNKGPAPAKPSVISTPGFVPKPNNLKFSHTNLTDEASCLDQLDKPSDHSCGNLDNLLVSKETVCVESVHFDYTDSPYSRESGEDSKTGSRSTNASLNTENISLDSVSVTEASKKKSRAPLPPAKLVMTGDQKSTNQQPAAVHISHPNRQDQDRTLTINSGLSASSFCPPILNSSSNPSQAPEMIQEKTEYAALRTEAGQRSENKSLPQARVSPIDAQPVAGQNNEGERKRTGDSTFKPCRAHAVKPLSATDNQPELKENRDNFASAKIADGVQVKKKVLVPKLAPKGTGPYSQLTHEELVNLLEKQKDQLSQKDAKIMELEQYIDNLLVRVMEEKPSILMTLNLTKKSV